MATKKRSAKKKAGKKRKKAARPKKIARRKKPVAKPSRKKKPARKAKRASAGHGAPRKGARLKATTPPVLGDWTDDAADEHTHQATLFDDDMSPDYGGSK